MLQDYLLEDYINLQFYNKKNAEDFLSKEEIKKHLGDDDYFVKKRISLNYNIPFEKIKIVGYEYDPANIKTNQISIKLPSTGFDLGENGVWCIFEFEIA